MNHFFQRLKKRKLVQWAVAYVAAAFALLQGMDIIAQQFGWPEGVRRGLTLALVVGFFVTLVLAWYHGERGAQRVSGTELLIIGLVLTVGGGLLWRFSAGSREGTATLPNETRTASSSIIPAKSIAVLPFENLSDDKNAAYFADGIQDEILTKLASVADLKVISRTSTAKYKSKPEDLKVVSQQLGVAHVLEGSVQRSENKVRVNVQLIDARIDSHLWAKTYDRDVKDIFAVESEVSQEIADALQAKPSPAEATNMTSAPTANTEAYDFFLKGEFEEREAESSLKPEVFDQAADWYRRAIALDPKFALAIARLVNGRMQRHWFVEPLAETELQEIRKTAQGAVTLAPGLAEARVSLGIVHYFGHRQYEEALTEFRRAIELQPNNARALEYSGYVHRRLGRWQECLTELGKAEAQDPREAGVPGNLSTTYTELRMWKEAERYATRALALNPHTVDGMRPLLISSLNGRGDVRGARRLLETFPPDTSLLADATHATVEGPLGLRAYISVLEGNYPAALQLFKDPSNGGNERARFSAKAAIHVLAGDAAGARSEMEQAVSLVEARLKERPSDLDSMIQLSWICLVLDRKSDALKFAQQAADLLPSERDSLVGTFTLYNLGVIKARTGDAAGAIDILGRLLAIPAGHEVSLASLKINPFLDPIRNDAGFQQLLAGTEKIGP